MSDELPHRPKKHQQGGEREEGEHRGGGGGGGGRRRGGNDEEEHQGGGRRRGASPQAAATGASSAHSGPIKPGCYVLRNVATGSLLGVKDGEWEDKDVQCWPAGQANTKLNDLYYNRYLIYDNPGQKGTVNLLNLRAGAFMVHHDNGSLVKSKATNSQSKECSWIPDEAKSGVFTFKSAGGPKYLAVKDGGDKDTTVALKEAGKPDSQWKLESTPMDDVKTADWMSMVEDQSTKFNMLTIVGTHQTIALNKATIGPFHTDNPHCQNHGPYIQLCRGIRFFDIRLNYHPWDKESDQALPGLVARHGVNEDVFAWEGYSFSAVVGSIAHFLEHHKGETIFAQVRLEGNTDMPKKWSDIWFSEILPFKQYFHHVTDGSNFADYSLEDIRGKAVIWSGTFRGGYELKNGVPPEPLTNYQTFWEKPKRVKRDVKEGPGRTLSVSDFEGYYGEIDKYLEKVEKDQDPNTIFWLGLNSSGKPAMHDLPTGEFYNPHDFAEALQKKWMPKHINEKVHPKGKRLGLITVDFMDECEEFVKFMINRNKGVNV